MNSRKRYSQRRYAQTRKNRRKTRRRRAVSKRRVGRTARRVHTRRRRRRTSINHKGGSSQSELAEPLLPRQEERSDSIQSEPAGSLLQRQEKPSTGLVQSIKDKAGQIKAKRRLGEFHKGRIANFKKNAAELQEQTDPSIEPSIDEIRALFKGGKYIPDIDGLLLSNVVSLRHMILCAIEETIYTYGTGLSPGKTSLLVKETLGIPFTKYKVQKETKQATYYRLAIREAFDLEEVSDSTELIILVDLYNRVNNYISFLRKRILSSDAQPGPTSIYNHVCTILEKTVDNADTRTSETEQKTTDTKEVLEQLFETPPPPPPDTPGTTTITDGDVVVVMELTEGKMHSIEKRLLSQYSEVTLTQMQEKLQQEKNKLESKGYTDISENPHNLQIVDLQNKIDEIQKLKDLSDKSSPKYFDNIETQYRKQMEFYENYETQNLRHAATHDMVADAAVESVKLAADIYGTSIENAISSSSVAKLIGEAGTKAGIIATGGLLAASNITVKEFMKKLKSFVEKCVANTNAFYDSHNSEPYRGRKNQVIFTLKGGTQENQGRGTVSSERTNAVRQLMVPETNPNPNPGTNRTEW